MPIPELTTQGLLPLGVHDGTLEEVVARFGAENPRRVQLGASLVRFVELAREIGVFVSMFVDGSFTTNKPLPGDIDVVLQCPSNKMGVLWAHVRSAELEMVVAKNKFEVHLFIEPSEAGNAVMVKFFQSLKTKEIIERRLAAGTQRGIVKVRL